MNIFINRYTDGALASHVEWGRCFPPQVPLDEMRDKLAALTVEDLNLVKLHCQTLLTAPWHLFKIASLNSKRKGSQEIADLACSVLHEFGFLRLLAWKPERTTGKAPVYAARRRVPDRETETDFYFEFSDALWNVFGVRLQSYSAGLTTVDPAIKQEPPSELFKVGPPVTQAVQEKAYQNLAALLDRSLDAADHVALQVIQAAVGDTGPQAYRADDGDELPDGDAVSVQANVGVGASQMDPHALVQAPALSQRTDSSSAANSQNMLSTPSQRAQPRHAKRAAQIVAGRTEVVRERSKARL